MTSCRFGCRVALGFHCANPIYRVLSCTFSDDFFSLAGRWRSGKVHRLPRLLLNCLIIGAHTEVLPELACWLMRRAIVSGCFCMNAVKSAGRIPLAETYLS